MIDRLAIDQGDDPGEVLIGVVNVGYIDLLALDEHAEMLAYKLNRSGGGGPVAGTHSHHSIALQVTENPCLIEADALGCRPSASKLPSKTRAAPCDDFLRLLRHP
jgi:hypothetical protein